MRKGHLLVTWRPHNYVISASSQFFHSWVITTSNNVSIILSGGQKTQAPSKNMCICPKPVLQLSYQDNLNLTELKPNLSYKSQPDTKDIKIPYNKWLQWSKTLSKMPSKETRTWYKRQTRENSTAINNYIIQFRHVGQFDETFGRFVAGDLTSFACAAPVVSICQSQHLSNYHNSNDNYTGAGA